MPYFPPKMQSYKCQGCGGTFLYGNMACLVNHSAGTCCHHFEIPVLDHDMKKSDNRQFKVELTNLMRLMDEKDKS